MQYNSSPSNTPEHTSLVANAEPHEQAQMESSNPSDTGFDIFTFHVEF